MTIRRQAYTLDEVATILHVSRRHVERLVASGVVLSVRIGGARRVPVEAFHREYPWAERMPEMSDRPAR